MTTFDVNMREVCYVKRIPTNTPLQALVTLNDPVYLEAALSFVLSKLSQNLAEEAYSEVMAQLADLRVPIDSFFDKVTVNCEDRTLRVNRLGLLSQIRDTMNRIADFSQIEGGER